MTKDDKKLNKDKAKDNEKDPPEDNGSENEVLIPIPMSEYDGLQKQIGSLQAQVDEYLDGLQRERANFTNYKKRIDQEQVNTQQNIVADIARSFLVVIDDMDRALQNKPQGKSVDAWVNGIELIRQKMLRALENQGVERFDAQPGTEFDPNLFEAITHEENDEFTDGQVIAQAAPGYKIKERIIRPALVRVAK